MTLRTPRLGAAVAALALGALPALAQPAARRDQPDDILALRRLLVEHRWTRLDSALAARAAEVRADVTREGRYVFAFDAFATGDSAFQAHLDAWIASEPDAARPRAARATYFLAMASSASRHGPTDAYASEANRETRRWTALAAVDATAGLEADSTEVMAYAARLDACRTDDDALRAITRELPGTVLVRARVLASLGPRCNGTLEDMSTFAIAQAEAIQHEPRLRLLRGLPAFYDAVYAASENGSDRTLAAYSRALSEGEFWEVRYQRAVAYLRIPRFPEALVDLDRVIDERPGYAPAFAWRAATLKELAKRETGLAKARLMVRAWKDIRTAIALDVNDPDVAYILGEGRDDAPSASQTP